MKYLILMYGSQQDYDGMAGRAGGGQPAFSPAGLAAMGAFMESFGKDLAESGELVDAQGLTAPVHARRLRLRDGVPVVTDGPYAETEEVLAGYWLVDCDSFDRATEIAARLSNCPGPGRARGLPGRGPAGHEPAAPALPQRPGRPPAGRPVGSGVGVEPGDVVLWALIAH